MDTDETWKERLIRLETYREEDRKVLNEIQEKVNTFHDDMTRYRGFLGAVTFFGSALLLAVELFKDWILNHWK